jgi:hypothetical protein
MQPTQELMRALTLCDEGHGDIRPRYPYSVKLEVHLTPKVNFVEHNKFICGNFYVKLELRVVTF